MPILTPTTIGGKTLIWQVTLLNHYWNWETLEDDADAYFSLVPEKVCPEEMLK